MTTESALKWLKNAGPIVAVAFAAGGIMGSYVAMPNKIQQVEQEVRVLQQLSEQTNRRMDLIDRRLDRITCLMEENQRDRPDMQRCALMQRMNVFFEGGNGL